MTTITVDVNGLIQSQVAKLTGKLDGVLAMAEQLQQVAIRLQSFDPELNKNFPKRDEIVAQFDQDLTCKATEFKTHMMETRAKLPKPKPPIKPVVAVWPGIQGGSPGV